MEYFPYSTKKIQLSSSCTQPQFAARSSNNGETISNRSLSLAEIERTKGNTTVMFYLLLFLYGTLHWDQGALPGVLPAFSADFNITREPHLQGLVGGITSYAVGVGAVLLLALPIVELSTSAFRKLMLGSAMLNGLVTIAFAALPPHQSLLPMIFAGRIAVGLTQAPMFIIFPVWIVRTSAEEPKLRNQRMSKLSLTSGVIIGLAYVVGAQLLRDETPSEENKNEANNILWRAMFYFQGGSTIVVCLLLCALCPAHLWHLSQRGGTLRQQQEAQPATAPLKTWRFVNVRSLCCNAPWMGVFVATTMLYYQRAGVQYWMTDFTVAVAPTIPRPTIALVLMISFLVWGGAGLIAAAFLLNCKPCLITRQGTPMFLTIASAGVALTSTFWAAGYLDARMINSNASLAWAVAWVSGYSFAHNLLFSGSSVLLISLAGLPGPQVLANTIGVVSRNVIGYGMGQVLPGMILQLLVNGGACRGSIVGSGAASGPCNQSNTNTTALENTTANCSLALHASVATSVNGMVCPKAFTYAFLSLSLASYPMLIGYAITWWTSPRGELHTGDMGLSTPNDGEMMIIGRSAVRRITSTSSSRTASIGRISSKG